MNSRIFLEAGRESSAVATEFMASLLWLALAGLPAYGMVQPPIVMNACRSDRILVKPKPASSETAFRNLRRTGGDVIRHTYAQIGNLQVVNLAPQETVTNALRRYRESGLVDYAEPDYLLFAARTPNEAGYFDGSQWALFNWGQLGGAAGSDIDAARGWDFAVDASSVIVAILDTGVRATHEDLAANLWINPGEIPGNGIDDDSNGYIDDVNGINAINGSGDLTDEFGHGTHVAGILGAVGNNGVGMVGTAWKASLLCCKFLDTTLQGSISDAVECIDYARAHGAKVVNASWGGVTSSAFNSSALYEAIASLRQAGIIFVAAAGNFTLDNDSSTAFYPASFDLDNIISVAATTRDDDIAHFSDYGLNSVDLGAPGYIVLSCWSGSDNDYRTDDGTSMAAPHVSAACALAWTISPGSTYQQIIQYVLAGVDPVPALAGKCRTGGRLNLYKVLSAAAATAPELRLICQGINAGQFAFRVSGPPSTSFELQASSDLRSWSAVQTLQLSANGTFDVSVSMDSSTQFFRAAGR